METGTANVASPESAHERATRKTLGYLVLLCCAILCMMGLLYHTIATSQSTPQAHPRATPTSSAKPPALPPPLSA
jgi:hypothetical protein